jgi:hypothetical protein
VKKRTYVFAKESTVRVTDRGEDVKRRYLARVKLPRERIEYGLFVDPNKIPERFTEKGLDVVSTVTAYALWSFFQNDRLGWVRV